MNISNGRNRYVLAAVFGGLFLAGSVMQSPNSQAKGAYASPVSVMNTSASPVVTEHAARIPYQATQVVACSAGLSQCIATFTGAPAGYRLVIENVSGMIPEAGGTTFPATAALTTFIGASVTRWWGIPTFFGAQIFGEVQCNFNQTVRAYFDASAGVPQVHMYANFSGSDSPEVTISGYIENCTITGCPAIQP
jgi:hypothetical protein